jgi:hypothetical protein
MSARVNALKDFAEQTALAFDQLLNVLLLGAATVVAVLATGREQAPCFADETMSAHAHRAWARGRIWGRVLRPLIDVLFFWQAQDEEVNAKAGARISGHCERAYWKEIVRRNLPSEYHTP